MCVRGLPAASIDGTPNSLDGGRRWESAQEEVHLIILVGVRQACQTPAVVARGAAATVVGVLTVVPGGDCLL